MSRPGRSSTGRRSSPRCCPGPVAGRPRAPACAGGATRPTCVSAGSGRTCTARSTRPARWWMCCCTVAGVPVYSYRAIDGQGQVVDVYVSERRAAEDTADFFRRAIAATGVVPDEVAADCAAAYPPALAAVLPGTLHETGKQVQQRIECDHQHLKGRLRPTRGFETLLGARVLCRAHAFLRNPRAGFSDLGHLVDDVAPAAAAGRAGVGRPDGDTPGSLIPATTRFPGRACSRLWVPSQPPHNSTEPNRQPTPPLAIRRSADSVTLPYVPRSVGDGGLGERHDRRDHEHQGDGR